MSLNGPCEGPRLLLCTCYVCHARCSSDQRCSAAAVSEPSLPRRNFLHGRLMLKERQQCLSDAGVKDLEECCMQQH